jgi:hypothetical protein
MRLAVASAACIAPQRPLPLSTLAPAACVDPAVRRRGGAQFVMCEPRGLSRVVGGVHGGKYQFGERGAVGYDGRQFAESLASAAADSACEREGAAAVPELPGWARSPTPHEGSAVAVHFHALGDEQTVQFCNPYRTWEPWYAAVVGDGASGFELEASSGTLAPRGGANNVCDASQPYPDCAQLRVRCLASPASGSLVINIEQDKWTFSLAS